MAVFTKHRALLTLLLLLVPALILLAPASAGAQIDPSWDHYKVYRVAPLTLTPSPLLRLTDQFGISNHSVVALEKFANPVEKEHAGQTFPIGNVDLHYAWWRLTDSPFSMTIAADNQFGGQTLTLGPGQFLLNPALKNMTGPLPAANHYKCYQCSGNPVDAPIVLTDQFDAFTTVAQFPQFFCTPVEKGIVDGPTFPILDPDQHYVCYTLEPQDPQTFAATFTDQFLQDAPISLTPGEMICVPTEKVVATPATKRTWGRVKILYR